MKCDNERYHYTGGTSVENQDHQTKRREIALHRLPVVVEAVKLLFAIIPQAATLISRRTVNIL